MSALNAFVTDDATFLFSDAAICHPQTLALAGLMNKVEIFPQYCAAVAATGRTSAMGHLFAVLAAHDFADRKYFVDNIPNIIRRLAQEAPDQFEGFRIVIAGPGSLFCIQADEGIGTKPFEMTECPVFITPAAVDENDRSIIDMKFDAEQPAQSGLAIMRAQREKFAVIGGWCQMTTIKPNHIETRILERWPDKIGERINPEIRSVA
ncbi:hypothetical protein [Bradyrhizobium sp. S69]|uniref:hypothetical protein n=1 Tax=Bradyrhizobium sp. S69 TaxID=1641856 RepID=UPI00131C8422|nr:hypothetical protein [Bradyrhizobium sp. S69]